MAMDETTDVIQPEDAGQGDGGTSDTPYAEYLDRIPEEVRGQVEPVFKDWDSNVTRRFQEAAEYRKQWEPYEQTGINQISPDEAQWLLQFREARDANPQAVKEWYEQYAEQNGLTQQEAKQLQDQTQQQADQYGGWEDPTAQQLKQQLEQQLGPIQQRLEAFAQWQEQQEFHVREEEANRYIRSQLDELKEKHPDEFNEEMVERLSAQYIESDPRNAVPRGFADWQKIRNQIQKDTLQSKVNQPAAAESGGTADAVPEEFKTLADANKAALARLREARQA